MGGKSSKEPLKGSVTIDQVKNTNTKGYNQPKGNSTFHRQLKKGESAQKIRIEDRRVYLAKCFIQLFFRSERLNDIAKDEEILKNPLEAYEGKCRSVEAIKHIYRVVMAGFNTLEKNTDQIEKMILDEMNTGGRYEQPAVILFSTLLTGLKILKIPSFNVSESLKEIIINMVRLPVDKLRELSLDEVVFEVIAADVKFATKEDVSDIPNESERAAKIASLLQKYSEAEFWPLVDKFPKLAEYLDRHLFEADDEKAVEFSSLLNKLRCEILKDLRDKLYNNKLIKPFTNSLQLIHYRNFHCLFNLNFGYMNFDSSSFFPRVKRIFFSMHVNNLDFKLLSTDMVQQVTIDNRVLVSSDPIFRRINTKQLVENLAHRRTDVDLKHDFDSIAVFKKGNYLYYTHQEKPLFGNKFADGNIVNFRLYFTKSAGLYDDSTYKIMFSPHLTNDSKTQIMFLFLVKKTDTLESFRKQAEDLFKTKTDEKSLRSIMDSMISQVYFTSELFHSKPQKALLQTEASRFLQASKWATPMKNIIEKFGNVGPNDDSSIEQIDLIISSTSKRYQILEPSDSEERAVIQNNPIYLKTELSDIWDQIFDHHLSFKAGEEFEENEVRNLLPAYLYVNLENISNMINVPLELEFNSLVPHIQKLGLELNHRYRALGFIAQYKSGEYYNISIERQKAEAFSIRNGSKIACPLYMLNPNQIKAVYFERREAEV